MLRSNPKLTVAQADQDLEDAGTKTTIHYEGAFSELWHRWGPNHHLQTWLKSAAVLCGQAEGLYGLLRQRKIVFKKFFVVFNVRFSNLRGLYQHLCMEVAAARSGNSIFFNFNSNQLLDRSELDTTEWCNKTITPNKHKKWFYDKDVWNILDVRLVKINVTIPGSQPVYVLIVDGCWKIEPESCQYTLITTKQSGFTATCHMTLTCIYIFQSLCII